MAEASGAEQAASDPGRELALARERLAFYESFDRLIQDNIGRSGDLLRRAAEERDAAAREVAAARLEVERRLRDHRQVLLGLADEVQSLSRQTTDLSRRILDAVQALQPELGADEGDASVRPAVPEVVGESVGAAVGIVEPAPDGGDVARRMVDVIVHGLPGPGAALDLHRHLASLPGTASVDPREFQGGIARFVVETSAPLTLAELRGWDGAASIEPLHQRPDVLELAVGGAAGAAVEGESGGSDRAVGAVETGNGSSGSTSDGSIDGSSSGSGGGASGGSVG